MSSKNLRLENIGKLGNFATVNMVYFLFPRQDNFITTAQGLHHATWQLNVRDRFLFMRVLDAFQHAYVITFSAIKREDANSIDREFDKVTEKVHSLLCKDERDIKPSEMAAIRKDIFMLFRMLYRAQQHVGLGVPKEDRLNPKGKIRAVGDR